MDIFFNRLCVNYKYLWMPRVIWIKTLLCFVQLTMYIIQLQKTIPDQGFQIRPVRSNRRPPVAVYQTGLTGNRLNSNLNSKSHVQPVPTGLIGLPAGMTGLPAGMTDLWFFFIFLNSNLNFELGPVDRFDRFTSWFDRFTGRYDRFGNFYFFEFKFEFWIGAGLIPAQTVTGPDRFDR